MSVPEIRWGRFRGSLALAGTLLLGMVVTCCGGPTREVRFLPIPLSVVSGGTREGGFSDLVADRSDSSGRTFWTISDRGPNAADQGVVWFSDPGYHQKILKWRLDREEGTIHRIGTDSISLPSGRFTTGLPSALLPVAEKAWAGEGSSRRSLPNDSAGFDFEGLAADGAGGFWLSDEYGPRLVHAVREYGGLVVRAQLAPGSGLPRVFARRAVNKGMEGLTMLPSGRLVGMMQGPLRNSLRGDAKKVSKHGRLVRIASLDPQGKSPTVEYAYLLEPAEGELGRGRIGAMTVVDEQTILVVEDRKGKHEAGRVDLWLVDLSRATDVHSPDSVGRLVEGGTLEDLATDEKAWARSGIAPVRKRLLVGDLAAGFAFLGAKAEGVAILDDSTVAIAFDDDFGSENPQQATGILLVPVTSLGRPSVR